MTNVVQMNEIENKTNETAAVSNYALRIKEKLTVAATAWKEVAQLFAEAANEFGLQSDAMRSLLKQTSFSESNSFIDAFAEHLMVNHNIYSCDLLFNPTKQDLSRVPDEIAELAGLIEAYFEAETSLKSRARWRYFSNGFS
jgi:hypothetical protein